MSWTCSNSHHWCCCCHVDNNCGTIPLVAVFPTIVTKNWCPNKLSIPYRSVTMITTKRRPLSKWLSFCHNCRNLQSASANTVIVHHCTCWNNPAFGFGKTPKQPIPQTGASLWKIGLGEGGGVMWSCMLVQDPRLDVWDHFHWWQSWSIQIGMTTERGVM